MLTEIEPRIATTDEPTWLHRALHFGWLTILVGAIAMAATYPGRTHGLGMVTEPLLKDLDLADPDGRVFYSTLNFWGTLIGAAFCLPVGWMFDRFDQRLILAGNLILLGLAVLWMSTIQTWEMLFVGLILTRGLGQSALSVVSITIVAKAFQPRQVGLAMAFYAMLSAPLHIVLIQSVGWALRDDRYDWRTVWGAIGVALIALSATALLLFRPARTQAGAIDIRLADDQSGATIWQALGTPAFWVVSLTISVWGMIYAGVALFNVDIFRERGFDQSLYFNVLSLVTIVALASKFVFGWLVNYVSMTRLLTVCLLATAGSLCGLPFATEEWHAYVYGVGLGVASGAVALLFFAAWNKMYGKRDLGRIQGVAQMFTVFASALGPWIFSLSKRATTSYTFIFLVLAGLVVLMAIGAWFTPVPKFADAGKRLDMDQDDRAGLPPLDQQASAGIKAGEPVQYKVQ